MFAEEQLHPTVEAGTVYLTDDRTNTPTENIAECYQYYERRA